MLSGKLLGASGGAWEGREGAFGQGSDKKKKISRVSRKFLRRLGEPCGTFGQPSTLFLVLMGDLGLTCSSLDFDMFLRPVWDSCVARKKTSFRKGKSVSKC